MNKRGITLLEIIVAMGILALLAMMISGVFSIFAGTGKLIEAHSGLIGVLREARSRTLASEGSSNHGVHFETSRAVLFQGDTYNSSDPLNKTFLLSTTVEINSINLTGGVSDVVFTRLQGTTTASGTITVRLVADTSKTRTITILPSGGVQ